MRSPNSSTRSGRGRMSASPRRTCATIDALLARQVEIAERAADDRRTRCEHADVVEVAAILGDAPGRRFTELLARLLERFLAVATTSSTSSSASTIASRRGLVLMLPPDAAMCTPAGSAAIDLAQRTCRRDPGLRTRDLEKLHAAARRRLDLRLQEHEGDVQEEDRPGHAERIGHRVAHRGIVVAERRDRGLQRRRAGAGAGEQSHGVADVEIHHLHEQDAHDAREQHADERDEIGLAPVGAGQAEEELLAVLHADGVEEEREARACPPSAPAPTSARTSRWRAPRTAPRRHRARIP